MDTKSVIGRPPHWFVEIGGPMTVPEMSSQAAASVASQTATRFLPQKRGCAVTISRISVVATASAGLHCRSGG